MVSRRAIVRAAVGFGAASVVRPVRATHRSQAGSHLTFALKTDDLARVQPLLDDYSRATNVTIVAESFPQDQLYEKLNINLIQSTGAYDVVSVDDPWMPLFAGGEYLVNLQQMLDVAGRPLEPGFVPELLALGDFPIGSGLRGLPWVGNVQVFAHRADVLAELGLAVPETWEQVLTNADAIQELKGADGVYGFGLRGMRGNAAATSFLPILRGHGVNIFASDVDFEPRLTSAAALRAIRLHLELAKRCPPGVENTGHVEQGRNLAEGRIAQAADIWPDQLLQTFDPAVSRVVGAVAAGAEPARSGTAPTNMTGTWLLAIPEGSDRADLALEFILWLTAPAQQKRLLLERGVPATRTDVLVDPEAIARLPFLPGLLEAAKNAVPRPRTQYYPGVEEILGRKVAEAIAGIIPGDEAMRQANTEIRALMVREGELEE